MTKFSLWHLIRARLEIENFVFYAFLFHSNSCEWKDRKWILPETNCAKCCFVSDSRFTQWENVCTINLHSLSCFIYSSNSSLNVNILNECLCPNIFLILFLFCFFPSMWNCPENHSRSRMNKTFMTWCDVILVRIVANVEQKQNTLFFPDFPQRSILFQLKTLELRGKV